MVLCHGGPGLWDYLAPVAAMVEDLCTVHRYDQRGGGRSPTEGPFTVDGFVADLDHIRRRFGHDRIIVGGHSWGASLALLYGLAHPERVSAVVYLNGTGLGRDWKPSYDVRVNRLSRAHRTRFVELQSRSDLTADEEREQAFLHTLCDLGVRSRIAEVAEHMVDRRFRVGGDVNAAWMSSWMSSTAPSGASCPTTTNVGTSMPVEINSRYSERPGMSSGRSSNPVANRSTIRSSSNT